MGASKADQGEAFGSSTLKSSMNTDFLATSSPASEVWWSGLLGRAGKRAVLGAVQAGGTALVAALSVVLAHLMLAGWPPSLQPLEVNLLSLLPNLVQVAATPEFAPHAPLLLSAVVFPLLFHWLGVYRRSDGRVVPFGQTGTLVKGVALGTLIVGPLLLPIAGSPLEQGSIQGYLFLAHFTCLSLLGQVLFHSGTLIALLWLQTHGIALRRVVLVQGGAVSPVLIDGLNAPSSEYRLLGRVALAEGPDADPNSLPCLGAVGQLGTIINEYDLDEVLLVADPSALTVDQRLELAQTCWRLGVALKMVAPFYPFFHTSTTPEQVGDVTLLQVERLGLYARWPQVLKRAMDVLVSATVLMLTGPVLLATILLIKLDSPGPPFFVQTRVGLNGRTFRMLKLRSMRHNADPKLHQEYLQKLIKENAANQVDKDGKAVYKMVDDPRITRVGKFIRKTSIDELPQLLNVLRGEMSLVGPRPPLPYEVAEYEGWHYRRLNIRPGITGLWQVSGRSRLTYEQMIRLDIEYIENWSLWLDIKILLRTVPTVLKAAHSY